jgi:hypothetical protein
MMTAAQRETKRLVTEVIKAELTKLDAQVDVGGSNKLTHVSPSALFNKGGWRGQGGSREDRSMLQ